MEMTEALPIITEDTDSGFFCPPPVFYFTNLFKLVASVASLTLLYPLAYFLSERQKINNTYIDGKKLYFSGKLSHAYAIYFSGLIFAAVSVSLINIIINSLRLETALVNRILSAATAGINVLFTANRLRRWKFKNVHYTENAAGDSYFGRNLLKSALVGILSSAVSVITLGISYPLVYKIKESYYIDMSVIDGDDIYLDGKVGQLFGKWLLGLLLCILTLGLFIPMLGYFLYKWEAENTHGNSSREQK